MTIYRAGSMRFSDPEAPRWAQVGAVYVRQHRGRRLSVYRDRTGDGRLVWRFSLDGQPCQLEHASLVQAQKAAMQAAVRGRMPVQRGRPRG